ncbi:MAG TPA: class I SAM-dependent methyltransferase [Arenicellales bacterium]|nr:class I SAM-dependent methyltransferase [Arenicellales bacterium]
MTAADLTVAAAYATPGDAPALRGWADRLGIPCAALDQDQAADLWLVMERGMLSLRDRRGRGLKALSVDLDSPEPASKKQLLGRAVGRRTRTVVDATAGWGDDSRRLLAMGYSVTLLERNPLMAALLHNAAQRAASPPVVVECEAIDYLVEHPAAWDCVYLDPMFPPKRRSSTLARRKMRLLRELAGDDPDRGELFAAAGTAAARRVVVKRPDHHEPLAGRPAETVAGKLVCYDVYFTQGARA